MAKIKMMKTNLRGSWLPPDNGTSSLPHTNQGDRSTTRAELHSQLDCCLLHMFIGRPFILAHRHNQVRDASSQSGGANEAALAQSTAQWDFLVQDCVAAAERAISICHELQIGRIGLAKASYTEYSSCRASLLVLIAHSICYRTNDFSETLRRGLDAIREMASVGDSARSEVSLIEMLESALHRLREFDSMAGTPAIPTMVYPEEEGYAGFVDWYTKAGACADSENELAPSGSRNAQASGVRSHALDPGLDKGTPDQSTSSLSNNALADVYPFDFDLLQMDADPAFFTSGITGIGEPEKGIFESLFWMPR
ncbi:hypothetical protein E8E13_011587 [Curvularia kusanoi]|uniref:Uncharacterized protein n=1 Tax=Curvularia kusanoi TaxID=90978 RepID=A0A9P4WEV6_CURKU|nr:hypothetical protein E8E13_011587 [Curvularia kusanoi]